MLCGKVPCKGRPKARRKRIPGAARSFFHRLARARGGVPQQGGFPCWARSAVIARGVLRGVPAERVTGALGRALRRRYSAGEGEPSP